LSLFSTRYIVEALGKSDYGLYVVVGGAVALLGFITNALVITTQRYVSFYYGKSDIQQVTKVFANSLFVHLVVSLILGVILLCFKDYLIYHWLNIPEGRDGVAANIYMIAIVMLVVTIIIAPFKALFIARENITYISLVEVCDGILKLGVAMWVLYTDSDRLLLYALLMLVIQIINLAALSIFALRRFEESRVLLSYHEIDFSNIRKLAGFAGWSTYGMGAVVFRNQGIQLMLNRAYDTVMNAAYGIAMQVFASTAFVATSILNAMNPRIVKAEGEGNRAKMLHLAEMESKYSTMLLMLIVIPIIFEAPEILSFWLKDMPEKSDLFCRFILCAFIVDQATCGLNTANQAIGRIKWYTILMYTPKVLLLLPVYFLFQNGQTPFVVMCVYLTVETIVSFARLIYFKMICNLSITHFVKVVFLPLLPLLMIQCVCAYVCMSMMHFPYRFLLTISLSIFVGIAAIWKFALTMEERDFSVNLIRAQFVKKW
jgi:Na+-driven multidrug efflux pump